MLLEFFAFQSSFSLNMCLQAKNLLYPVNAVIMKFNCVYHICANLQFISFEQQ